MVKKIKFYYFTIISLGIIFILFSSNSTFVIASHVVNNSTGGISFYVNEDLGYVYNISINNTDSGQTANITWVNITLPSNLIFRPGTMNGTNALANFSNTSIVLMWVNVTSYVINGSEAKYFWFNATATNPGTYYITVTTLNATNVSSSNLTVTVNDTTAPSLVNFNSPTPNNNTIAITTLYVNVSAVDNSNVSYIIVRLFNSSRHLVNSSISAGNFTASFTGLTGGATYYINASANDSNGNTNTSQTRQIIFAGTGFQFNGTIRDNNGIAVNNTVINITVSSMGAQGPSALAYYATTSNASGWFNITLPAYGAWMYKPVIRHTNSTYNTIDLVGPTVSDFPYQEFSMLNSINFYLKQAGIINITAINSSGDRITFNYQIKDTKLGYPIAYDFTNFVNEANIYVPADRNYSVMVYPSQSLPVSFNWNNFSSSSSYRFGAEYPQTNLSNYNATTKTVNKQFNTSNTNIRLTGFINVTGIDGWDEFKVAAILLEPGNMVYLQYGILPYNMSAWAGESDVYNLTSGFYNITVPGPAETQTLLLLATARNGTSYYGGFKNVSVNYSTTTAQYNFTRMYGMLGDVSNLSLNNPTSQGTTNVTCKKQSFNLLNSTNNTFTNTAHIEAKVDYSNYGAMEFTFMQDVAVNTGTFSIPLLNVTGVKEFNVFVQQGAPKRLAKTASQIVSNNNITISSFAPGDIDGALANSQITISMYKSNTTCDVPSPDSSCLVTSSGDLSTFNPLSAVIGGGSISFRMGTSGGILIHYVNVDMLASGPPEGLFENDAGTSESSTSFSNAMKFGSAGPTMYDYVLISMPYVEGSTSVTGLNESSDINLSIPNFYGQNANGNMNWTTPIWSSSNGTNASAFAGNYSHYSTYQNDWQVLMQSKNCTKTFGEFNRTNPCYIDTTNNRIWIRLPHFSGTAPSATGNIVTATSSSSSSSGGGGSGSGTSFWINTQSVTAKQFEEGYTQVFAKKYRLQVSVEKKFHYVGVIDLTATTATINVSSKSFQETFKIGDEKKFDVNEDRYYDISVKLNSISNNKANVTIKKINESIISTPTTPVTATTPTTPTTPTNQTATLGNETKNKNTSIWIVAILVPIVIIVVIIIIYLKSKVKKSKVYQKIKVFDF